MNEVAPCWGTAITMWPEERLRQLLKDTAEKTQPWHPTAYVVMHPRPRLGGQIKLGNATAKLYRWVGDGRRRVWPMIKQGGHLYRAARWMYIVQAQRSRPPAEVASGDLY